MAGELACHRNDALWSRGGKSDFTVNGPLLASVATLEWPTRVNRLDGNPKWRSIESFLANRSGKVIPLSNSLWYY